MKAQRPLKLVLVFFLLFSFTSSSVYFPKNAASANSPSLSPKNSNLYSYNEIAKLLASDPEIDGYFGTSVIIFEDTLVISSSGAVYVFQRNQDEPNKWLEVKKLTASDTSSNTFFGSDIAINQDTLVVGASGDNTEGQLAGAAYVYQRDQDGANQWGEITKLTASDASSEARFGTSVAISGETIVIGASEESGFESHAGAAYIFQKDQGGLDNWGEVKKLTASDLDLWDRFGSAVAIDGDTLVVAAFEKNGGGYVYIFDRNLGGTNNWGEIKNFSGSATIEGDHFGDSVDISGNWLVVGSTYEDTGGSGAGAAYLFMRDYGGSDYWGEFKKLTASDSEAGDNFGKAVSIDNDIIVVGARVEDEIAFATGAAYIFQRDQNGLNSWGEVSKIKASDAQSNDRFGASVSVSNGVIAIGANYEDSGGSNAGAVYLFSKETNLTNPSFGQLSKITASDGEQQAYYGTAVSISGNIMAVGTEHKSVYIYYRDESAPSGWSEIRKLIGPSSYHNDYFGESVSVSGNILVVGAAYDRQIEDGAGAAYIYQRDQGGVNNWGLVKTIFASDPSIGANFGRAVSIYGNTIVVGADGDDQNGLLAGAAYVFEKHFGGENNWGEVKKILASDGDAYDDFGYSVSIDLDTIIVGAARADSGGAAYIYERNQNGLNMWGETKKIIPIDNQYARDFGISVDIDNNTAIIGDHWDTQSSSDAGAAYIFQRDPDAGNTWGMVKKIIPSDIQSGDNFGYAVAISGEVIVIGSFDNDGLVADSGSVYVYEKDNGGLDNWGNTTKLSALDANSDDAFGISVSIDGEYIFVGASYDDEIALEAGAAYLFGYVPSPNTGFQPNPDGFSCTNIGSDQFSNKPSNYEYLLFEKTFDNLTGINKLYSEIIYQSIYKNRFSGSRGHCHGMSAVSLLVYLDLLPTDWTLWEPNVSTLYDIDVLYNATFRDYGVGVYQGAQLSTASVEHLINFYNSGSSVSGSFNLIKNSINEGEPIVVSFVKETGIPYSEYMDAPMHSVVAYRYEFVGENEANVYIYEVNDPNNQNKVIEFQLDTDYFFYQDEPGEPIYSSTNDYQLLTTPASVFTDPDIRELASLNYYVQVINEHMDLKISNQSDLTIGLVGNTISNTIAGAAILRPFIGDSDNPVYVLPPSQSYETTITSKSSAPYSFTSVGPNGSAQITGASLSTSGTDVVTLNSNLEKIIYTSGEPQNDIDLSLLQQNTSWAKKFTIEKIGTNQGENLIIESTGTDNHFSLKNDGQDKTYSVRIQYLDTTGQQVFYQKEILIESGDEHIFIPDDWQNLEEVILCIDRNNDRICDEYQTLENEFSGNCYLPLIIR